MGEHKRRGAEITELKKHDKHAVPERVIGYSAGLQVAAGAMRLVLARKASLGIITDETAQAIFEGVGKEIDEAVERAFKEQELPNVTE